LRFIFQLIRRRYFSNELPAPSPWSLTPREDTILPVETVNDEELFKRKRWTSAFLCVTDKMLVHLDQYLTGNTWVTSTVVLLFVTLQHLVETFYSVPFCSYGGQRNKYNGIIPLPAQRNLTPPLTLYPQQPMSSSSENYRYHRFSSSAIPEASSSTTSRLDINLWSMGWVTTIYSLQCWRGTHRQGTCWILRRTRICMSLDMCLFFSTLWDQ
jgi:Rab-like protein 3